jgi:hypothetical protein
MATINIGSLSFTHKGDYASGTTYAKNDVVYYSTNGNAYIAKQATTGNAPTSTAHWDVFAAGSGGIWNAGLSLGSAGQSVKVNAAGNALEFGDAGGGVLQIKRATRSGDGTFSSSSAYGSWGCSVTITPTASDSSFWINAYAYGSPSNHDTPWKMNISDSQVGATTPIFTDASRSHTHMGSTSHFAVGSFGASSSTDDYWMPQLNIGGMYTPASNNGNARTFDIICRHSSSGTMKVNQTYIHNNSQSSGGVSTIEVWEIANGIYS